MISKLQKRLNLSDQEIEQIKKEQADVVFNKIILLISAVALTISLTAYFVFQEIGIFISGIVVIVILMGIGIYAYDKESKEFSQIVKDTIVKGLFKEEFTEVIYQPEKGFDESFISDTEMYSTGNRYYTDDLLSANYKGVGFMQADILMQQVTSNGKTTTTTTLFHGRWFICDFIKDFNGYHQIRSNGGFFKNTKPFNWFGTKTKKFEFEGKAFTNKFTAYTTDEQEAFYLINPGYMERLEKFVDYINEEIVFGFIDNKLHVAIYNNKDAFELKGKNLDQAFVDNIEEDIKLIKLIIDELDLELDIFK